MIPESRRIDPESHINDKKAFYDSNKIQIELILARDSDFPIKDFKNNTDAINFKLSILEKLFEEVAHFIKNIKKFVPDVLTQDTNTACYFLLSIVYQNWEAAILLGRNGFYYEFMQQFRGIAEAEDLVYLFIAEGNDGENLRKWFKGSIIQNSISRQAKKTFIDSVINDPETAESLIKMMSNVYSGLSAYTHNSYAALIDHYDVYNKDCDFNRYAGAFHLSDTGMEYAYQALNRTVITLKHLYGHNDDMDAYRKLDGLLYKIPEI
jgi:hypothetical protein